MKKIAQLGLIVFMLMLLASCNTFEHKGYEQKIGWIGTASINEEGEITLNAQVKR